MKLKEAMRLTEAVLALRKRLGKLHRRVRELEAEREHWEADAAERIREIERSSPPALPGFWLVTKTDYGRCSACIAQPEEIPNPLVYAGYAQHQNDLARALTGLKGKVSWCGTSAYDLAGELLRALYEAEEQRQGKEPRDGE